MDGNFVCAADLDKIVVWNSRNGKFIRVIPIVPHYNSREDPLEAQDRYCWKGMVKIYLSITRQYFICTFKP